ncbi:MULTISPECIES: hypothetical protein [unclassified Devosia]|uniref:hypothetical protein n=1 Tax=unclassified Devosia TaxID=196773 RepID=UPI0025F7F87C|nr:hypothetical protein [Devosia sp.]MCR6636562.1 hypothetical protein [Devosia sp.]
MDKLMRHFALLAPSSAIRAEPVEAFYSRWSHQYSDKRRQAEIDVGRLPIRPWSDPKEKVQFEIDTNSQAVDFSGI